jgi:glycosyltransferase A (GT-A) superfamily protein (DUF2064 family)
MQAAFELLFDMGYKNCIIVGSDLFDLKSELIETAFTDYKRKRGGAGSSRRWRLLFVRSKGNAQALFQNKDWGTSSVLQIH